MSVYTAKTARTSSILKSYSSSDRDKSKNVILNKVRFDIPKQKGLLEVVNAVEDRKSFIQMEEFVCFLKEMDLNDHEFLRIFNDARSVINQLSPKFSPLVEALLSLSWIERTTECRKSYSDFCVGILVAHNKYLEYGLAKIIEQWIPTESCSEQDSVETHILLQRIITAIPMAFDATITTIETLFPYYKRPTYVIVGYVHNLLKLMQCNPIFYKYVMQLIMQRMVILDVHAPRASIADLESDDEDSEEENLMFELDDLKKNAAEMKHPIANTLDICMLKILEFLKQRNEESSDFNIVDKSWRNVAGQMGCIKVLIKIFDDVILPIHNSHHAQFILFYFCSLKQCFAEAFMASLWNKIRNPNCCAVIRQASVGYIASFLARSNFIRINILKQYLQELCSWAYQYIQGYDHYNFNNSLKANLVFFSVCQAIFYVIAFRSKDLTSKKKNLLFLQSLHLSALVTCHLNPLRVCLPAIATTFAGVTRTYQLAYCHAILERNARRKLATIYANDAETPEETLDTFFPFDPYLLKRSNKYISPIYLVYQASDAEETTAYLAANSHKARKRGDSEMMDDHDVDDFILNDKRQKVLSLAKSQEKESQFNSSTPPGFHT